MARPVEWQRFSYITYVDFRNVSDANFQLSQTRGTNVWSTLVRTRVDINLNLWVTNFETELSSAQEGAFLFGITYVVRPDNLLVTPDINPYDDFNDSRWLEIGLLKPVLHGNTIQDGSATRIYGGLPAGWQSDPEIDSHGMRRFDEEQFVTPWLVLSWRNPGDPAQSGLQVYASYASSVLFKQR